MIRMNPNKVVASSAKVVFGEKEKLIFRRGELENLEEKIEKIQDELKKADGKMLFEYIMHGRIILLEKKGKKIHLFGEVTHGKVEPTWIIEQNPELFSLLKNLF